MSANYYIKHKIRKVNEPDLHIGKNSVGWQFSFRAYEADDYYETPELKCKQQWVEYIFLNSDSIFDEYNQNISFEEFLELLKNKSPESDNRNHHKESFGKYSYIDDEGWSFTTVEFF